MFRINLWLGKHKKNIQVVQFPLWFLKKYGNIGQNVWNTKNEKCISFCKDKSLVVKIDIVIFLS